MSTSGPGSTLHNQQQTLSAKVKNLVNNDLRLICRGENLAVSGVKSALQTRILQRLDNLVKNADVANFDILRHRIYNKGNPPPAVPTTTSDSVANSSSTPNSMVTYGMASSVGAAPPAAIGHARPKFPTHLRFKESPFYSIEEALAKTLELHREAIDPKHPTRNSESLNILLTQNMVDRMRADSTLRVLIYCAEEPLPHGPYQRSNVTFPAQLEIKVNHNEVKANTKGLKNKPGTTLPADVTGFIRKQPAPYCNNISVTYALTQKKYWIVVMLVKRHSVDELTERIRRRSVISKQRVITEMVTRASDPDLQATSARLPLKDPVSAMRIALPLRSTEQAPTWTCPICNNIVAFEGLAVDQYVQEILLQTPKSIEGVTIEPSGQWSYAGQQNDDPRSKADTDDVNGGDDSDDLLEITETRGPEVKTEQPATPYSLAMTPPVPSPGSVASAARAGQKRKSEVIDLTLSEDEEPPAKRPAIYQTLTGLATPDRVDRLRNGYPSFSRALSNHALRTNSTVSFQQLGSAFGGGADSSDSFTIPNAYQAGSPLAPITISSPPPRESMQRTALSNTNSTYHAFERSRPAHHPPPQHQASVPGGDNPLRRAALIGLAGRRPYDN